MMAGRHAQRGAALKMVALLLLLAPAIWLPLAFWLDLLGAKPFERLIEETAA